VEIRIMLLKHKKLLFKQQYQTGHICKREPTLSWNIDAWYPWVGIHLVLKI